MDERAEGGDVREHPTWWRFWCNGCEEVRVRTFSDLTAEREAAVAWFAEHAQHDLGGFVTPDEMKPCEDCNEMHSPDKYRSRR